MSIYFEPVRSKGCFENLENPGGKDGIKDRFSSFWYARTELSAQHFCDRVTNTVKEGEMRRTTKGALADAKDDPSGGGEENLKMRNGIVLMPQPSDDPTDPLNW